MEYGVTNIILIVIAAGLLIALVTVLLNMRKKIINSSRRIEHRYRQEISFYDSELTRVSYLYNDLLQQKESEPSHKVEISNALLDNNIVIEQKRLKQKKNSSHSATKSSGT